MRRGSRNQLQISIKICQVGSTPSQRFLETTIRRTKKWISLKISSASNFWIKYLPLASMRPFLLRTTSRDLLDGTLNQIKLMDSDWNHFRRILVLPLCLTRSKKVSWALNMKKSKNYRQLANPKMFVLWIRSRNSWSTCQELTSTALRSVSIWLSLALLPTSLKDTESIKLTKPKLI